MMRTKAGLALLALASMTAGGAHALKFEQLAEGRFIVVAATVTGNPTTKAMKKAYGHAASVCRAAGYEYLEVINSSGPTLWAGAKLEFRVYHENADGRIDCTDNADAKIVEQAKKKLAKMKPPA